MLTRIAIDASIEVRLGSAEANNKFGVLPQAMPLLLSCLACIQDRSSGEEE
jgi:hypothetical protein